MPALISQANREKQIKGTCEGTHYSFVRWDGEYKGKNTRFICKCEKHGEWSITVNNFVNHSRRCLSCYDRGYAQRFTIQEYTRRAELELKDSIYRFVRFQTDKIGLQRKAIFNCEIHGDWTTTYANVVHQGKRCKGCAIRGFKTSLPGTVYALRSEDGLYVKVGISNRVKTRIRDLKFGTPFEFSVIEMVKFSNGKDAVELERMFHEEFDSAKFKDFDGAREWLHWDDRITEWFRLFQN